MSEQKKLRKKLGREPTADELKTASELRKAKKQAAADALVKPTVPAATTSAQKKRAAPGPTGGSAAKKRRVAKNGKKAKKGKEAKKAKGLEGLGDLFGLSRLKGVVQDGLYIELLEVAMVANQTLAKQTARADRLRAKLAEQTRRADRLRADLRDSIKERLVLRGIVDLRSILDDVLPASKEVEPLVNWLQGEQAFVGRCKAEAKITADTKGKKAKPADIAKRLAALWVRACSPLHPAMNPTSWKEVNVGRVLPLDAWLTDSTDLLLTYHLLDIKGYPVDRPRLIDPTPTAGSPEA